MNKESIRIILDECRKAGCVIIIPGEELIHSKEFRKLYSPGLAAALAETEFTGPKYKGLENIVLRSQTHKLRTKRKKRK